jgi:hypothetical protein
MRRVQSTTIILPFRINALMLIGFVFLLLLFHPGFIQADTAGFETDYEGDVEASDPLLVNSMKTTMYEFVSDDEEIYAVGSWISKGSRNDSEFKEVVLPILKENCTKCHSVTSTMSDAIPDKPLARYAEIIKYIEAGLPAKPSS